jgi:hypothetical protein
MIFSYMICNCGEIRVFFKIMQFLCDFRKQLSHAASQGSVESRIKANINNIQRSGREMNKNFARR